ncbi:hypothetical protein B0T14DRAFT_564912 [Immersiella caudata]|uniref:Radical SAM core domain-containing protein n=1 Tax=Immersiella caudata TaxID=314043 RepID=A0AA40C3E6_9PEZI|nr:hypothetical protein B0T14DRAFT_564912 [Immersiella caudata]
MFLFPVSLARPFRRPSQNPLFRGLDPLASDHLEGTHDYLRISVTERCNLRCLYCMPEEGISLSPNRELLTTPEIVLLSTLFVAQGVTKIRLTGGEPTVRHDIVPLMQQIGHLRAHGLRELCLTTNGLSLHRKLDAMVEAGLTGVNLSLDTLDPWQFQIMTRRNGFSAVRKSIDRILEMNRAGAGVKLKINCVVMRGLNDREILPFVEMTKDEDIEVRFIEYMPFDGNKWSEGKMFSYQEMLDVIRLKYPELRRETGHKNDTSKTYHIPSFAGRIGFITSMTHNFCGTCNRLRITSDGNLKVCLFGNAEVSLRDILRKVNSGEPIDEEALGAMKEVAMGKANLLDSAGQPAPLLAANSDELLQVIGMAVKNKKEKHAGIGELEHMKNRPMILIGDQPPSPKLTHVSATGSAHMVSIASKSPTQRTAIAKCTITFTNPLALTLIRENQIKKGDVLGVARVAGIMAAKKTSDIIPLCHPIGITSVGVEFETGDNQEIDVTATVSCEGKTGVEMEALTAAGTAALTVYDMCKAVDKGMVIGGLRVVLKEGGKSGRWVEGERDGSGGR